MNKIKTLFLLSFMLSASVLQAADKHEHEHSLESNSLELGSKDGAIQLAAHEHGVARMELVVDDKQVLVNIESPAANIIGFEHAPKTAAQKKSLETAKKQLQQASKVLVIKGDDCHLEKVQVTTIGLDEHEEEHLDEHKEHAHDHEKHEQGHAEFKMLYAYHCHKTSKISSIEMTIFEIFPAIEAIDAQWIFTDGQGAGKIDSKNRHIKVH